MLASSIAGLQDRTKVNFINPIDQFKLTKSTKKKEKRGADREGPPRTDILEEETKTLENTILYIEFRDTVLVHEGGQDREGGTSLRYYRYCYRGTHSVLSLLYLEVVEENC